MRCLRTGRPVSLCEGTIGRGANKGNCTADGGWDEDEF